MLQIQWTQPGEEDYCDKLLYLVSFSCLMVGWVVLLVSVLVFLADKIFNKLLCCTLCSSMAIVKVDTVDRGLGDDEEQVKLQSNRTIEY